MIIKKIILVTLLSVVSILASASQLDNQKRFDMLSADIKAAKAEGKNATARYLQKELGKIVIRMQVVENRKKGQ